MMKNLHAILVATLCSFILGCGAEHTNPIETPSKQATHLSESQQYCDLYKPQRWLEMRKTMTFPEMVEHQSKSVESVIKTKEFRLVLSELHNIGLYPHEHPKRAANAEILYRYTVDEISKLTHSDFSCLNLKIYYQQLFIDTTLSI
ncbi:hypothetical protein [Litoribacillus peritrichatus]|uniref:Uncharacterized protein n=1 Tax=Litoribacillus peritrichatus TaxID=718191 RepID=A0ABP7N4K0_9GAMM